MRWLGDNVDDACVCRGFALIAVPPDWFEVGRDAHRNEGKALDVERAIANQESRGDSLAVQRMTVDRFEGEAREIAVCELDDGTFADVPVADLPEGAREGTVLKRAEGGMWVIDADEETARRARIQRKMDALFV